MFARIGEEKIPGFHLLSVGQKRTAIKIIYPLTERITTENILRIIADGLHGLCKLETEESRFWLKINMAFGITENPCRSRRRRRSDERTHFCRSNAFDRFLLGIFVREERNMSIFVKGVEPPKEDDSE